MDNGPDSRKKRVVEDCLDIDIRYLARMGLLSQRLSKTYVLTWSHNELATDQVMISVLPKNITLALEAITDSNFSSTIPWFDYLFGTASNKPYAEHENLEVGLEYFRSPQDTRLDRLLLMPFRKF